MSWNVACDGDRGPARWCRKRLPDSGQCRKMLDLQTTLKATRAMSTKSKPHSALPGISSITLPKKDVRFATEADLETVWTMFQRYHAEVSIHGPHPSRQGQERRSILQRGGRANLLMTPAIFSGHFFAQEVAPMSEPSNRPRTFAAHGFTPDTERETSRVSFYAPAPRSPSFGRSLSNSQDRSVRFAREPEHLAVAGHAIA